METRRAELVNQRQARWLGAVQQCGFVRAVESEVRTGGVANGFVQRACEVEFDKAGLILCLSVPQERSRCRSSRR
jgi:hypothetical protein